MSEAVSFFLPEGSSYRATELARGPWNAEHAHGGPPAALLARALESMAPGSQAARFTLDLVRPVPLARLEIATSVLREGRTTKLVQATLKEGEKDLCRATALFIRTQPIELPELRPLAEPPKSPASATPFVFPFFTGTVGYHTAMETRVVKGEIGRGPMTVWMRMRHPLVPGETPTPLQRVLIAVDSGNGVSFELDPTKWTFVNPDLTLHLDRLPRGEWVSLDAHTTVRPNGIGLAESALFDEAGPIGRSLQSLVVAPR
jgi:hypothetical protein